MIEQWQFISSSNTSKSAWASYENCRQICWKRIDLRFEQAEYERVTKRGEELYKTYEEAENKSYDENCLDASE